MVRPLSARAFWLLNRVVCINLSGLFVELLLLAMMGFARPRPS